jgi:hypothetical protein
MLLLLDEGPMKQAMLEKAKEKLLGRHRAGLIFSRVRTDTRQKVPLACQANRYWFLAKLGQHSRCKHYQHSSALVSTGSALPSELSAPGQHYQHLSALGVTLQLKSFKSQMKTIYRFSTFLTGLLHRKNGAP